MTDQLRCASFHVAQIDLRDASAATLRKIGRLGCEGDKSPVAADRRMVARPVRVAARLPQAHTPGALHDRVANVDVECPISIRRIIATRRTVADRQIGSRHEGHVTAIGTDRGEGALTGPWPSLARHVYSRALVRCKSDQVHADAAAEGGRVPEDIAGR